MYFARTQSAYELTLANLAHASPQGTHTCRHEWSFSFQWMPPTPRFYIGCCECGGWEANTYHSMCLWMKRRKRPTKINYFVALLLLWYRCEDVWNGMHMATESGVCACSFRVTVANKRKDMYVNAAFEISRIRCRAQPNRNHIYVYTFTSVREASHSYQIQRIQLSPSTVILNGWCCMCVNTRVWISCLQNGTWCQYNTQQTTINSIPVLNI